MNYYPHHIGDYSRDTAHLSMLEDAAYRRMLDLAYATERPLPLERDRLYRLIRAKSHPEKLAVDVVLGEFFIEGDDGWHQKRVELEIEKGRARTQAAQENGKKGGRPETQRVSTDNPAGLQEVTQVEAPNNQKPLTKNQEPKDKEVAMLPPWLPKAEWKAWLEVRKQKKAPNTPRALNLAATELERLKSMGQDPAKVLDQSTLKGWKSLHAVKVDLIAVTAEPAGKLCDYCVKVSTCAVNGRRACDEHWDLAMGNTVPFKAVA